jgi:hypothetical protein
MGGIMKNAPNALIWAVSICFVAVVGAFVALSATGSDSADLRMFLNTVLNIVAALFSGGALVVAGAAARSSSNTEQNTNGHLSRQSDTIRAYQKEIADLKAAQTKEEEK